MAIEKWKTLKSVYLVKEKWATMRVTTCEMPDGTVKDDYYVLEYPDWANAVGVTKDGKILMVRQYRLAADLISLEIPGGVIEPGEDPEKGVLRELLEETGFTFETCKQVCTLYPNPATSTNKVHTFLLTGGEQTHEQALDEHEELEVETYTIAEVKQLLADNKIAQAMHVAGLSYAFAELDRMNLLTQEG